MIDIEQGYNNIIIIANKNMLQLIQCHEQTD